MPFAHLTQPVHRHFKLPHWQLLQVLRHRRYCWFWSSTIISNLGTLTFVLAMNWVVLQRYGAPGIAAIVLAYGLPQFLLELPGGIITDHHSRTRILQITQSLMTVIAFLVAGLVTINYIPLWLFVLANVFNGAISAFDSPARTVLINKLVPPEELVDAQELYGTTSNAIAILGPALSGVLLTYGHTHWVFWFNAISFIPILVALLFIRSHQSQPLTVSKEPALQSLVEGVKYATKQPDLRYLILLAVIIMVLGMPYQTLLSIFTHDVLHQNASAYASLASISGCGAFFGSIAATLLSRTNYPGRILFGNSLIFGIALLLYSQATSFWVGLLLILVASTAGNLVMIMISGLSQLITPSLLQGRIASISFLYKGALSISAALASYLCHFWGLANTQLLFAGAMLLPLLLIRQNIVKFNPNLAGQKLSSLS